MTKTKNNTLGQIGAMKWTEVSIDCYKRGCVCNGCFFKDFFSDKNQKCQVKASVLELIRTLGVPNERINIERIENNI